MPFSCSSYLPGSCIADSPCLNIRNKNNSAIYIIYFNVDYIIELIIILLNTAMVQRSFIEKLRRAVNPGSDLDKEEAFDWIFWFRVLFALTFGVVAGVLKFQGFLVIATFFLSLFIASYFYYSKVLDINEEELGQQEVMTEGFANSIGMFFISWILIYSYA